MKNELTLAERLQAFSGGSTACLATPAHGIAERLESVRRALQHLPAPRGGSDSLLMVVGGAEQWVSLAGDTVVGRAADAGVRPASRFVSAHHCRLSQTPDGWVVEDLGSKNGVFVNGRRVDRSSLCDGDAIQVADVVLILVKREEPEDP